MAALHLLPRELVHLLATTTSRPASSTTLIAGYSSRFSNILLPLQQFQRFQSDYRRVHLDSETARDFDRPSKGYEYPSISNNQHEWLDVASFTEEEDAIYHLKRSAGGLASEASTSSHVLNQYTHAQDTAADAEPMRMAVGSRAVVKSTIPEEAPESRQHRAAFMAMGNAANCLRRGDLDSALSWYIDAPPLSPSFARQTWMLRNLVNELRDKLMLERSDQISLIMAFATATASKGFSSQLSKLIPHIARFSDYDRLRSFWKEYQMQVQEAAKRNPRSQDRLTTGLINDSNRMVRALCLSARFEEAVLLLQDLRSLRIESEQVGYKQRNVQPFTYTLLQQEMSRHGAPQDMCVQVDKYEQKDYPEGALASQSSSTGDVSPQAELRGRRKRERRPRTVEDEYKRIEHMINRGVQPTKAQCAGIYMRALRSPSTHHLAAKLSRNIHIREARADYHRLGEEIHRGNLPTQVELARFAALCQEHNCLHYYERILERVAITQAEAQKRQLMSKMREGRLPSASELGAFVDTCVQAHQPHLASEVGQWMMRQPPRFRSLWICARVHRLLANGSPEGARDALIVFSQHYLYDGVPDNLKAYMQALPTAPSTRSLPGLEEVLPAVRMDQSESSPSQKPQMLASSHAIALALKAWFTLDPTPENVLDTYRSFISIYYNPHSDGNIPLPMMPDQVSFDIFLTPLVKKGRAEEAMHIMRQTLQLGVVPNAHNWDNIIGGLAKAGNSRMVTYILERMEGAGQIQVDSVIDSSSESASQAVLPQPQAQDTNTVKPTQSLQKATTLGPLNGQQQLEGFTFYPPSIVTYATIIRGMCLAGNLKAAQYFVRRMFAAKSPSGERIYRFMENEQAERALKIVSEMERMDKIGARTSAQRVLTSSRQSRPMVDTWTTKADDSRTGGATM